MSTTEAVERRPKRADARRNYDRLIESARNDFTAYGVDASLESIARQAGVGIGTLYRHFPTREALLEATYLEEVEALCSSADEFSELEPWDALVAWLHRFADYASTKRALMAELLATIGSGSEVFKDCHTAIYAVGQPLFDRAVAAGVIRPDVSFNDAVRIVSGVSMVRMVEPEEIQRLLTFALDGLRYRAV